MNIFQLLTPATYWLLIVLWIYIFAFYIKRFRLRRVESRLYFALIAILAIDAFRTLFESVYFGAWYTSLAGFLPMEVHTFLVRPEMVFIPKILNVVAAVLVIGILLRRWLPGEEYEKQRQEKQAVLGQLAGAMAHELRNPLGAVQNAVYFLNMALDEPEPEVSETLEILEKEVGTCDTIITDLLDFARTRPPTRRKMDINELLQEALSRIAVPKSVEVVPHLDKKLPNINVDPDQLAQVFGNIMLNGIQAMPEGGQLTVRSKNRDNPGGHPEWVAVSIADTGVGIPEENIDNIFEPLFTTKARGIGLGLALAKSSVEGHGGSIEVQSKFGTGTTFNLYLPVFKERR